MSRRRQLAAIFLSAAMVAILAVIVYIERSNATQTISVFMVRANVAAGTLYSDETVQVATVHAEEGDFAYERRGPADFHARFATDLHAGDILRSDDLVPFEQQVEITLTVSGGSPLSPGDSVDIFTSSGGSSILVGHHLSATTTVPALTVLVPARDEAAWVALASSSLPFHAVRSSGSEDPPTRSMTAEQALRLLCGTSCSEGGSRP